MAVPRPIGSSRSRQRLLPSSSRAFPVRRGGGDARRGSWKRGETAADGPPVSGVVLLPDGSPAAGVLLVYLATQSRGLYVIQGKPLAPDRVLSTPHQRGRGVPVHSADEIGAGRPCSTTSASPIALGEDLAESPSLTIGLPGTGSRERPGSTACRRRSPRSPSMSGSAARPGGIATECPVRLPGEKADAQGSFEIDRIPPGDSEHRPGRFTERERTPRRISDPGNRSGSSPARRWRSNRRRRRAGPSSADWQAQRAFGHRSEPGPQPD